MSEERKYLYIDSSGSSTNYLSYDAFYTIVKIMGSDDDFLLIERRLTDTFLDHEDFRAFLNGCGNFCGCFKFEEHENANKLYAEQFQDIGDSGDVKWNTGPIISSIIYKIFDINRKALRLYIENYLKLLGKQLILNWPVDNGVFMHPTIPEDVEKLFEEAGSAGVEMSAQVSTSWPSYALSFAVKNNLSLSIDEGCDPVRRWYATIRFGVNRYYTPPDIKYAGFIITGNNLIYLNKTLEMGVYELRVLRIILEKSQQRMFASTQCLVDKALGENYLDKVQVSSKNPDQAPYKYIHKIISTINQQLKASSGTKDRIIIFKKGNGYCVK